MKDLLRGARVRLCAEAPEVMARAEIAWMRDSEYHRLSDTEPMRLWSGKKYRDWGEERVEKGRDDGYFRFSIRALPDDRLIGVTMIRVNWPNADGIFGIAIGDRNYWGKGFGTEATRLMLCFAFTELNLRRLTLGADATNSRAIRSYEKSGFRHEGVSRGETLREGRRVDSIFMGILREEWEAAK
jgi:RimJ/RimL family protein N-acetyltransferase